MKSQLEMLQCPSDPSVGELSDRQYQWLQVRSRDDELQGRVGRYVPGARRRRLLRFPHRGVSQFADCHRGPNCRGIFFRHTFQNPVRMAKVTDGTTNTLMIGEDVPEFNRHSTAFYSNGDWCSCNIPFNHGINTPTELVEDFALAWWDAQGFRSRHPGGVHFCYVDGSVHFLSESINHTLFRTSCTRNGAETTGESLP